MNGLRIWVITLCYAAAASSVAEMVAPEGNIKKNLQFTLNVFMMVCVISIFAVNIKLPQLSVSARGGDMERIAQRMSEEVSRQVEEISAQRIEEIVAGILAKESIKTQKIEIKMDKSIKDSIKIESIEITLSKEDAHLAGTVKAMVEKETGEAVHIVGG